MNFIVSMTYTHYITWPLCCERFAYFDLGIVIDQDKTGFLSAVTVSQSKPRISPATPTMRKPPVVAMLHTWLSLLGVNWYTGVRTGGVFSSPGLSICCKLKHDNNIIM